MLRFSWPLIAMVVLQAALAASSIWVVSVLRAYVQGESQWSKAQKDAVLHLSHYADTGEARFLARFEEAIAVPLADRQARQLVGMSPPDLKGAQAAALRGGNHRDDVGGLIFLLYHFHDSLLLREPIALWEMGDQYIQELLQLAAVIRDAVAVGQPDAATRHGWQSRIQQIDEGATPATVGFSRALGESSRRITDFLLAVNALTAGVLVLLTLLHTLNLVTQRRRVEDTLHGEREQARATLAAIGDGVVTTTVDGRIVYLNPAAEAILERPLHSLAHQQLTDLLQFAGGDDEGDDGSPIAPRLLQRALHAGGLLHESPTLQLRRPDGSTLPVTVVGSPLYDQGAVSGAVLVLHDMRREQEYLEQLSWQATHDALTGLVNRREFERRLAALLARPQDEGHAEAAGSLLYVDLDQFKLINDTCGHPAGDAMLRAVCQLLQGGLREGDTLARLGGDEFGVLLESCPPATAWQIASELRQSAQALQLPWDDRVLRTGLSIGLVHLTPDLDTLQEVLRVADMACYGAKERGRNTVYVHQPHDAALTRSASDMDWIQRIRNALEHGLFSLHAQEIVPLQRRVPHTGKHVELLLRLDDGSQASATPGQFIPAAERFGLMPAIDRWVVRRALAELARRREAGDTPVISLCAINLSGTSVGEESLLGFLREQIALHGVPPDLLCFEITETAAIAHMPNAIRLIRELKQQGCRFSLDDFGAGMSSFTYLRQLPVDYLKIDGGLVRDIIEDPANRAMVEMINHIGHVMGKETIAEFAESAAIVQALRNMGIDHGQGYAIGRPCLFTPALPPARHMLPGEGQKLPSAPLAQRFATDGLAASGGLGAG
ncbi:MULTISPECIES: EAL domain-containing protein [unclassified Acidovorax]|uniref:EAL domain-containing protein n=1 Tax=unclassified Acidovorax TaxID=2684926 RepID=UPI0028832E06|nr:MULTISPECIES: EAL domain-containing protein [unclassified Acidovorax]